MSDADRAQNVFEAGDSPAVETPTAEPTAPIAIPETVSDLVGAGKKYGDINAALNSIKPAQEHINSLEADNRALRAEIEELKREVQARTSVSDVLEKLGNRAEAEPQQSFTPEQITQLVKGALNEEKIAATTQSNINAVNKALFDMYGEKAKEVVASKAQELGMSVKTLQDLAAQSPKAALAYFQHTPSNPRPNVATTNLSAVPSNDVPEITPGMSWKEMTAALKRKHNIT